MDTLTSDHPRFSEFVERLTGSEGCNFHYDDEDKPHWYCHGHHTDLEGRDQDRQFARTILTDMGGIDIDATFAYFDKCGGYCDCEIVFNVAP